MKLAVTTSCVLRCDYCFVDKNQEKMPLETAKKAIDFFLLSQGKEKILKIYGGEPLLNFSIVEESTFYAKKLARKKRKNLTLSICTNAVLLKKKHIDFFRENDFQLAISIDGRRETHDRFRKFPNGEGVFCAMSASFEYLFKTMDKRDMAANMSIVPSEAKNIIKNFRFILGLGFNSVNLEPVYGFQRWSHEDIQQFKNALGFISKLIISQIFKGNFIFLTTINRELRYKTLSKFKDGTCLFYQLPEVYPNGDVAFSSFFLNLPKEKRGKYIAGNVATGECDDRYRQCRFSRGSKICTECVRNYFDAPSGSSSSDAIKIRNSFSIKLAKIITAKSKENDNFKQYIHEAKRHICF